MSAKRSKFKVLCNIFFIFLVFFITVSASEAMSDVPARKTKKEFCDAVNIKFRQFGWNKIICSPSRWETFDYSSRGNPLMYQEFGFDNANNKVPVNLMLCGVHGDESVGVYQCFHMVRHIFFDDPSILKNFRLVIAPIVNPDGFFANTRQNGNGIDPNRNLPTKDWDRLSQWVWAKHKKDPRKYPGAQSGSEVESRLQTYLIDRYKPDKIISFHAPLGFLDFDGPGDQKYYNLVKVERRAKYLGLNIEANTKRFLKLVDFPFYPGSLGNYAGNERKIPTYTIELVTNDASRAYEYWSTMRYALVKALSFAVYDWEEGNPYLVAQGVMQQGKGPDSAAVNTIEGKKTTKRESNGIVNDLLWNNKENQFNKGIIIDLGLSPVTSD